MRFEIYTEKPVLDIELVATGMPNRYRWHLKDDNGKLIADSAVGYDNENDCWAAIALVQGTTATTPIILVI